MAFTSAFGGCYVACWGGALTLFGGIAMPKATVTKALKIPAFPKQFLWSSRAFPKDIILLTSVRVTPS